MPADPLAGGWEKSDDTLADPLLPATVEYIFSPLTGMVLKMTVCQHLALTINFNL